MKLPLPLFLILIFIAVWVSTITAVYHSPMTRMMFLIIIFLFIPLLKTTKEESQ